ncbi:MAG TPA: hypothetical protein VN749_20040 [Candidatus Eisenbacteria bacterium]|jgi:hypothetical protein|nr:hypothetical protein [Candidatus Eisenbacteria bacterium]
MNVRKSLLAVCAAGLVFAAPIFGKRAIFNGNPRLCVAADGTAPLPPLPKRTLALESTTVADGTAPLPPLPRPTRDLLQA